MPRGLLFWSILLSFTILAAIMPASARLGRWVVGGQGHPWQQWGTSKAMDNVTSPGAIQPREFGRGENLVAIFFSGERGKEWFASKIPRSPNYKEGDPRIWGGVGGVGGYGWGEALVDQDPSTTYMYTFEAGSLRGGQFYTLDFGIPVPANKFVFYPPQEGTFRGLPLKSFYMKGYRFSAGRKREAWLEEEKVLHHFSDVMVEELENKSSVVEICFPTQFLRFFRLENIYPVGFYLAEFEVYGEGFASQAVYESRIIDLGGPTNFGKLEWALTKWRRKIEISGTDTLSSLEAAPDAPISISVQTRSGKDDTPSVYHIWNEDGEEEVVEKDEWKRAPSLAASEPARPGYRASVTYDKENWSLWSSPLTSSGMIISSPGPRRYFQFRLTLKTGCPREMGRVDSLWFQISSPPLVESLTGEIAVSGKPAPPEGIATVSAGIPTKFTYDLKAQVTSPLQSGFDSLEVYVPCRAEFDSLQVGDQNGFVTIACKDSVWQESVYKDLLTGDSVFVDTARLNRLVVYFPSQPISYGSWDRLRLTFTTSVLVYNTYFPGRVWKSGTGDLPCSILAGDANREVTTNQLRVNIQEESVGAVLDSVWVIPRVITPNTDGNNDFAKICYRLLTLRDKASIQISIFDLSGLKVRQVFQGSQSSGIYQDLSGPYRCQVWDGKDDEGNVVSPGIYVYQVRVDSDKEISNKMGTIAVAY